MDEVFNDALNAPPGQLAEVLMKKVTKGEGTELADDVRRRLDRLLDTPGKPGLLARVRLAADLPCLFDRARDWTKSRLIPLFDWSSPEAAYIWSGRKYSAYIGSPELFGLVKKPFLEMFRRSDTPMEELRT